MDSIRVHLLKPRKGLTVQYQGQVLLRAPTSIVIRTTWNMPVTDVGTLCFAPGDILVEYFYSDRWYAIFDLRRPNGERKGWYCNIARPARITSTVVESEDLELDLLVSADRTTLRLEDEDEFAALRHSEPAAYRAALAAVDELRILIARGVGPFAADGETQPKL